MRKGIRNEILAAREALTKLDRQVLFILVTVPLLVIAEQHLGSRTLFRDALSGFFPESARGILAWGWWFGMQGILGFVIPVFALTVVFRKRFREIGLGLGDWRFAVIVAGVYLPLVIIGTWFLSDSAAFQAKYPHYGPATSDWSVFVVYELLFLFYWIGWEYMWRGYMLFGTAHVFGVYAIFVQAIPFALLHLNKPLPEALLSVAGGIALGGLVWRCRSFWIAVPIHSAQMIILDLWCTMRSRTDVSGTGLDDLLRLIGGG